MNAEILARGFVASQVSPATHYLFGKAQHLAAMMCTHVDDDLLFAYTDKGKEAVDAILNRFSVGKIVVTVFPRMMITQVMSTSETTLGT